LNIVPVLVDSNVLLDVIGADPNWYAWSATELTKAATYDQVVINPVIYAEVSMRYASISELETAMPRSDVFREAIPYEAAFLAGKAYLLYRRRKGNRRSPLPDFFIGAHAAVSHYSLLTRDPSRYRAYFPTVRLIAP
jgi:predicted nucleic acid-binding protein